MSAPQFDLTPDPRVLSMLGEISLDQWKCLAELIDNSIDAFTHARKQGGAIPQPEVVITLPTQDREDATLAVRDNGPGMTIEQLENAVRAGWSGNNPLDSLGLFGMGFNIATARLGFITEVYTTRAGDLEWTGLRIDLNELRRTRSYHTPRQTRPKANSNTQGTEIKILRMKPDQRAFFAKNANHAKVRRQLARTYAPLLLSKNEAFSLQLNGHVVQPRRPCYWDPSRSVPGPDGKSVNAVETFDIPLTPRLHCTTHMASFPKGEVCPTAGPDCNVVETPRRLRGWIGIQRYLHEEEYGLDLVRNGRVIEAQNKELFVWSGGERPEREYPIDDPRNRGRFIGEIHVDHCRVHYTKDHFERDDPAWSEMVALVRGEGPLRPDKARALGFGPSDAPLYRLFQVFRRSSPHGKTGRWTRILCVKNNERAIEMADQFLKGEADYQTDEKWYALAVEEDEAMVGGGAPGGTQSPAPPPPAGFLDDGPPAPPPGVSEPPAPPVAPPSPPPRQKIHELSRTYKHPLLKVEFNVEAFSVDTTDPALPNKSPWVVKNEDAGTRTFLFLFNREHSVFRSMTLTPLDALLDDLALKTYEFLRETAPAAADFGAILATFRDSYAEETRLDPKTLISAADAALRNISMVLARGCDSTKAGKLFDALPAAMRDDIKRKVAVRNGSAGGIQVVIDSGEFLQYATPAGVRSFFQTNPALFFDGKFWSDPFVTVDYGSEQINAEVREALLDRYSSYISDAVWLVSQSARDLERSPRDQLVRAACSVRLLEPDTET